MTWTKEHNPMFVLPRDLHDHPGSIPFRGIEVVDEPYTVGDNAWPASFSAAYRIYTRIKGWNLSGTLYYGADEAYIYGPINVDIHPVDYLENPMGEELNILMHGGWKGTQDPVPDWRMFFYDPDNGPTDEPSDVSGPINVRLWPKLCGTDGGQLIFKSDYADFFFDPVGTNPMHFGKRIDDDHCNITCTLPITYDGKFDGTDLTDFAFQIGSPEGNPGDPGSFLLFVWGELTLTPTFWPYDPLDGDGPYYDGDTGKWLRTPLKYNPALID